MPFYSTKTYGPEILSRFNLFSCISVNASAAQGYSSGDAIQAVQEVAKETLPSGYGFEFGGTSREEASSGTSIMIIFIICILFVYIILCSLYESLFIPLAVMLSIPFGLAGSFLKTTFTCRRALSCSSAYWQRPQSC